MENPPPRPQHTSAAAHAPSSFSRGFRVLSHQTGGRLTPAYFATLEKKRHTLKNTVMAQPDKFIVFLGRLLLSLGKQRGQRGRKAQKVILRGPCARPPTPFAHSSAPSRCSCGFHRSARLPLGSENTPRSSGAASPCGCLALPGCCQMAQ